MTFFEELKWRGLVYNVTDPSVEEKINEGGLTFYIGTDPTGDSLHVGHLLPLIFAKRLEQHGHHPLILIGGATGFIGDPKPTLERKLLTAEQVKHNADCLYAQANRLFHCEMVNNYDWISKMDVLTFLRDYGKLFNVNYMLSKETVKKRLDDGISYTEFSYQILQGIDFLHLWEEKNCELQIGGQDQWGNITSGLELIRKLHGTDASAWGLTIPLFTKSDGTKFGKTEGGAVWVDPVKTTPYEFYQFWINTPDSDVIKELKQFTFLTKEQIEVLEESFKNEPEKRLAQKALAEEMTRLVHGDSGVEEAQKLTQALFTGKIDALTPKEIESVSKGFTNITITEDTPLIDCLIGLHAASSKREARDFINNGAVLVNGVQNKDIASVVTKANAFGEKYTIIRRGKKNYYLVIHQ
jgi:tyrosyl-tRNA synthetase